MNVRRRDKRMWFVLLAVFVAVFLFTFLNGRFKDDQEVEAVSLANFDPGYIISDYQMGNYNSMSEAEIWNFLKQKGKCNDTRTYLADYYTSYSYHIKDGHFVCLADETFGDGTAYGNEAPNGESAAHIIWQAAQDYRINPQVLIVLLQKEQGLITDSWPNDRQYKTATGYGCPDTAPCNSEYYGFKNQVRKAAALFRTVLNGGWTNYPLGNNYIQYNPNSACGGSVVNIRSLATSALYRYTPYQPNSSALAAGYGTGDSCGAYGNRNFYLYFEDWFGGVTDEMQSANIVSGKYVIRTALSKTMAVDITGGIKVAKDKTNIQLYTTNNTEAQEWEIIRNDDKKTYTIKNPATDKVLDVANGSTSSGANVQLYTANNTCAQKWQIVKNSDGTYGVYSACSGLALDVNGASIANKANIQIYSNNKTKAQKLELVPVREIEEGEYIISSELSKKMLLDVKNGVYSAKNGTNIQIYTSNNTDAQKWSIKYDGDGFYTIKNPATDKVLDVANGSTSSGANVQLYTANNTCAQKWQIVKNSDGTYGVYSACSGLALDVNGGAVIDGANVRIYDVNDTCAQKWNFGRAEDIIEGVKYTIHTALSDTMVVDIGGGAKSAKNGTNIQIYTSNNTDAQEWQFIKNADGTYTILNPNNNKVLDVAGAGTKNGTNINLYERNNTCAQKWQIKKNGDETYTMFSACSGLALDVAGAGTKNGTNIQVYTLNNTNAQKWRFSKK